MSTSSNPSLSVTVRMNTSIRFTIPKAGSGDVITQGSTVLEVKNIIAKEEACDHCSVDRQRLIFKGRILSDDSRTLADYGLMSDNQTIHLVKGRSTTTDGSSNAPAAAPTPTPAPAPTPTAANTPPSGGAPPAFNPFAAMMQQQQNNGMPGMPSMDDMQQQLMQNPEMVSNMMQSPLMQNLMSNPDVIRMMMESNPEIQRVMDANPQMRAIMEDPELMRRSMEMMRDPSAMQNMMRNQELAMSQIENLPGGFNALRRMYEDVQEPMMDAMSGMGSSDTNASGSSGNNASSSSEGAGGTAMPNPWGSTSTTSSNSTTNASSPSTSRSPTTGTSSYPNLTNPWASSTTQWPGTSGSGTGAGTGASGTNTDMPGMPGMPGMNLEQTISMLENPVINNMMQQIMSDPATMQQMLDSNPMMQQMRQSNPAAASLMSNPEMMRAMMDPSNLRAMANVQRSMQQAYGSNGMMFPGTTPTNGNSIAGTSTPGAANNALDFSSLLNQFQATNVSTPSPPVTTITPEQRFERQLNALNDMGFTDREANIRALTACDGNVNRAVERLLSGS